MTIAGTWRRHPGNESEGVREAKDQMRLMSSVRTPFLSLSMRRWCSRALEDMEDMQPRLPRYSPTQSLKASGLKLTLKMSLNRLSHTCQTTDLAALGTAATALHLSSSGICRTVATYARNALELVIQALLSLLMVFSHVGAGCNAVGAALAWQKMRKAQSLLTQHTRVTSA